MDLAARQHVVLRHALVHLGHVLAQHLQHAGMLAELLVGGIGQVVALGPVSDGVQVDVEERHAALAAGAEHHRLQDVGEELELVLDVFGREHPAARQLAHVLGAVDDPKVAGRVLDEAGVACGDPAIGILGVGGRLGVAEILHEHARRAIIDLSRLGNPDLHPRRRDAHGVRPDLVVGLLGDEHRRLRLAVELFEIDPEPAVEIEDLRADGLTCGVAHADPRKAHGVLQGSVNQQFSQSVFQPVRHGDRLTVQDPGADLLGVVHEVVKDPPLQPAGILHADHHRGQLSLEHAGRGEIIGRPDLAQVGLQRVGAFGTVHAEPGPVGLPDAEDVVADPGHRQVGQDLLPLGQAVEVAGRLGCLYDVTVRQHHAFGTPRGAGGIEHDAGVVVCRGSAPTLQLGPQPVLGITPRLLKVAVGNQPRMIVFPKAPGIEIDGPAQPLRARRRLRELVHLLLISGDGEHRLRMVQLIADLFHRGVLVDRHRDAAGGLDGDHGPVERRAVPPGDDHMLALRQAQVQQPQRQRFDLIRGLGPGPALPDSEFLLAIGRPGAEMRHVPRQQRRN
ncbi:hypothetical protein PARU111607_03490 [Palleronia rufa]